MPIYDYECPSCGLIEDQIAKTDEQVIVCECGKEARRIITLSGVHCANDDSAWVRSAAEAFSAEDPNHAVRDFVARPTRRRLRAAMKVKGLRHLEPGEKPTKRENQVDSPAFTEALAKSFYRKHRTIEVR